MAEGGEKLFKLMNNGEGWWLVMAKRERQEKLFKLMNNGEGWWLVMAKRERQCPSTSVLKFFDKVEINGQLVEKFGQRRQATHFPSISSITESVGE
ncbi:hypothetical protein QE152_g32252 [Popillia japonica]|uniref:Uncharacterized protein n=1 Tax=Popillia japonica TaxID=7064 RepID=A0AAW1J0D3_POPJA